METLPVITTERLILRPFNVADAKEVQRITGDVAIAQTTTNVPHPYKDGMAESWIETHQLMFKNRKTAIFAATIKSGELVGCFSLDAIPGQNKAELGYWVGKEHWNKGYGTEAAYAVVKFGFEKLEFNKVQARHMSENLASGKIMIKIGMEKEGYLKDDVVRFGKYSDSVVYGILNRNFKR